MIFIVGSGLIGLSIGFKLLNNGFKVTIFNHSDSRESTLSAVGMLAPLIEAKPSEEELFTLLELSRKKWETYSLELMKYSNVDFNYKKTSALMIANNFDDLQKLRFKEKFYSKLGKNIDFLDRNETLKLEPNLMDNVQGSLYFKSHDQVNPKNLKLNLVDCFMGNGGKIINKKIEKLISKNGKVGVICENEKIFSDKVILSAGAWSQKILKHSFLLEISSKPFKGVSLNLVCREKQKIFHNLWFRNIYIAPRNDNEIMVGATEEEKGYKSEVNVDEAFFLIKNLKESLPFTDELQIKSFNSGLRPGSYDGLPILGTLDNISKDIICAFGHYRHGVLLAPLTAELVYDLIMGKEIYNYLSPVRFKEKPL
tara:strand:- start:1079 stop:2182 length:1104 start_codon:yes stop_codon:yes gene_type:complete